MSNYYYYVSSILTYLCSDVTLESKLHFLLHLIEPSSSQLLRLLLGANEELQEGQERGNHTTWMVEKMVG